MRYSAEPSDEVSRGAHRDQTLRAELQQAGSAASGGRAVPAMLLTASCKQTVTYGTSVGRSERALLRWKRNAILRYAVVGLKRAEWLEE